MKWKIIIGYISDIWLDSFMSIDQYCRPTAESYDEEFW